MMNTTWIWFLCADGTIIGECYSESMYHCHLCWFRIEDFNLLSVVKVVGDMDRSPDELWIDSSKIDRLVGV